jgi:hypothetical protein
VKWFVIHGVSYIGFEDMMFWKKYFAGGSLVIAVVLTGIMASSAVAAEKNSFASLKNLYMTAVKNADTAHQGEHNRILKAYIARIATAEKTAQKAGNLDLLLFLRKEKARCMKKKNLPSALTSGSPTQFYSILEQSTKDLDRIKQTDRNNRVRMTERYVQLLDALQKSLTREDKIEEALQVNKEVKRMRASPLLAVAKKKPRPAPAPVKKVSARKPSLRKTIPTKSRGSLAVMAGPNAADIYKKYQDGDIIETEIAEMLYYNPGPAGRKGNVFRGIGTLTSVSDNGWITTKTPRNGSSLGVMFKPYDMKMYRTAKKVLGGSTGRPVTITFGITEDNQRILFEISKR